MDPTIHVTGKKRACNVIFRIPIIITGYCPEYSCRGYFRPFSQIWRNSHAELGFSLGPNMDLDISPGKNLVIKIMSANSVWFALVK